MKIITVVGARPQFIKEAAFTEALKRYPEIKKLMIHTGQHFDQNMSEVFFETLGMPEPDYLLQCGGLPQGAMTGLALKEIEKILIKEKPNVCVVYGDTNATLAGALAASKLQIPVVHIEAGLRSHDFKMPEEINRVLTDSVSSLLCCPSQTAVAELKKEGFPRYPWQKIVSTGDIQFDSTKLFSKFKPKNPATLKLTEKSSQYLLATLHRPSNVDDLEVLESRVKLLQSLSETYQIIFPIHPRTKAKVAEAGLSLEGVKVIDPVGYIDMLCLIKNSSGVITDSGGLQKEAFYLGKRAVVLRDSSEWVELIQEGASILDDGSVGLEGMRAHFAKGDMDSASLGVYGNGNAAEVCIAELLKLSNHRVDIDVLT